MTTVWVTTEFESIHNWPEAIPPTEYLKYPHRHIFKVRLEVKVSELNREVEFISLKKNLTAFCISVFREQNSYSCEQMCAVIYKWCIDTDLDPYEISVSEDGENGACCRP